MILLAAFASLFVCAVTRPRMDAIYRMGYNPMCSYIKPPPFNRLDCDFGIKRGQYGCYPVCARGPDELCGGPWSKDFFICAEGLTCQLFSSGRLSGAGVCRRPPFKNIRSEFLSKPPPYYKLYASEDEEEEE